jgi:HAD superfamily hydrolase (TIGR01509 family)
MIKAIFFDCFGVLYLGAYRAMEEKYPQHARELRELTKQSDYGFLSQHDYIAEITEITGATREEIDIMVVDEYSLNRPLLEYIQAELKPHYKIGMISNIGRGWIHNFFEEHQLHDLFDTVILSGDEGVVKPNERIFELAAERIGVDASSCVMVDDLLENVAGADAAHMKSILYGNLRGFKQDLKKILI